MVVKHSVPTYRGRQLQRPRLGSLVEGDYAAVVFAGQSGTGKTVAMSQFVQRHAGDVVWVSLRREDATRLAFWSRMLEGLEESGLATPTLLALRQGGVYPETVRRNLSKGFRELTADLLIAVDDYHFVVDDTVDRDVLALLQECPRLSVTATTRTRRAVAPVEAATRVSLRVVDEAELAFDADETLALASQYLGAERAESVRLQITDVTKGWAAAVHALTVELAVDPGSIDALEQHSTFVSQRIDNELARAGEELRDALLKLSLVDELTLDLVMALGGWDREQALRNMGVLEREGIISQQVRRGDILFRLHALTRERLPELCRERLAPSEIRSALTAVLAAYRTTRPAPAATAAIELQRWDQLEQLVHANMARLLDYVLGGPLVEVVPAGARDSRPALGAYAALSAYLQLDGDPEALRMQLQSAARLLSADRTHKDVLSRLASYVLAAIVYRVLGEASSAAKAAAKAQRVVEELTPDEVGRLRDPIAFCLSHIAATYIHTGDAARSQPALAAARAHAARHRSHAEHAHALALSAVLAAHRGEMSRAEGFQDEFEALALPLGRHDAYIGAGFRIAAAYSALERADSAAAKAHLRAVADRPQNIDGWPFLLIALAWTDLGMHGPRVAIERFHERLAPARRRPKPTRYLLDELADMESRLVFLSGAQAQAPFGDAVLGPARESFARGHFDYAIARARKVMLDEATPVRTRSEARLLQAASLFRLGAREDARELTVNTKDEMDDAHLSLACLSLPPAVMAELFELTGTTSLWSHHLAEAGTRTTVAALTATESAVLRALHKEGQIDRAARALFVSPNTVKTHLKTVYRKLNVSTRTEALARAHVLGLLDEQVVKAESSPRLGDLRTAPEAR